MRLAVVLSALALGFVAGTAQAGELLFGKAQAGDDLATVATAVPGAKPPKEADRLNGADLGLEVNEQFHFGQSWRVRYFFLDGKLDAVQLARNPPPGRRLPWRSACARSWASLVPGVSPARAIRPVAGAPASAAGVQVGVCLDVHSVNASGLPRWSVVRSA